MIESGEVPAYKAFTHEPEKKRQKRIAKENREAEEAEEMKKELGMKSGKMFCIFQVTKAVTGCP